MSPFQGDQTLPPARPAAAAKLSTSIMSYFCLMFYFSAIVSQSILPPLGALPNLKDT
jgi:hypothetical protein